MKQNISKNETSMTSPGTTETRRTWKKHSTRPAMAASILAIMFLLAACGSSTPAPALESASPSSASAGSTDASPSSSAPVTESATVAASDTATAVASDTASASTGLKEFTVDELAKYDGQNGNPAYVAVDGNVYDVSGVSVWKKGSHFGKYFAGRDLSKEILLSPHGKSKFSEVPLVGTLKQ